MYNKSKKCEQSTKCEYAGHHFHIFRDISKKISLRELKNMELFSLYTHIYRKVSFLKKILLHLLNHVEGQF